MLFILKITITPVLVALMSLAARRWGPMIGGLIMGLPWMTGPILFFLGLERGHAFVAQASAGVLLGSIGIGAYLLAYVTVARWAPWPMSLGAAFTAYCAVGYLSSGWGVGLWQAGAAGAASLLTAFFATPRVKATAGPLHLPWWDIPMRMLATAMLIAIITVSADVLGPEVSGIVATYPVILTVIGAFTHSRWGFSAVVQLFRGVSLSLLSFITFFLVLGSQVERIGLVYSFAAATAAALSFSAALIATNRMRTRARLSAAKAAE